MNELIAQTPQPQQNTQQPQGIDPTASFLIALTSLAGVSVVFVRKYLDDKLAASKERSSLDTLINKSKAELDIDEQKNELNRINEMAQFNLEIIKDAIKNNKQLLELFITTTLNRGVEVGDQLWALLKNYEQLCVIVAKLERDIEHMQLTQKDILNVLKMHERQDNKIE